MADRSTLRFDLAPLHDSVNAAWRSLATWAAPRVSPQATDFNQIIRSLELGNEVLAFAMYAGEFSFAGETVSCSPAEVFSNSQAPAYWQNQLHDLHWLKHFTASNRNLHAHFALRLLGRWTKSRKIPRDVETLSRIVMSLATHGQVLAKRCDKYLQAEFLDVVSRAVTRLHRKTARHPEAALLKAMAELYAITAFCGLERHRPAAIELLQNAIDKIILPDGGHVSRSPAKLVDVLAELLPLRLAMKANNQNFPVGAIDRMIPMLRLLSHGDGGLAHTENSEHSTMLVKRILQCDDLNASPHPLASHSGFAKLVARQACLIADTKNHFAIEFSDGEQRLFKNAVNLAKPARTVDLRQSAQGNLLTMTHEAGYQRSCFLAADGADLRVEDVHIGNVELRFDIHPDIKLLNLREGKGFMLVSPNHTAWNLTFRGAKFHTEHNGAVIRVANLDQRCINWALKKQVKAARSNPRGKASATDLLDL